MKLWVTSYVRTDLLTGEENTGGLTVIQDQMGIFEKVKSAQKFLDAVIEDYKIRPGFHPTVFRDDWVSVPDKKGDKVYSKVMILEESIDDQIVGSRHFQYIIKRVKVQ